MAKKKQESVLGLAPLTTNSHLNTNGRLALPGSAFDLDKARTREERWTIEELNKQELVVRAQRAKTNLAASCMADVLQHADGVFVSTVEFIEDTRTEYRSEDAQAYVDEFSVRMIQLAAHHMLGVVEVGNAMIAQEVGRPLYPPVIRVSFWDWLLGR